MIRKRSLLLAGALIGALAVPAGVAVAAGNGSPAPTPDPTATNQPYGPGPGYGRMGGGTGDPKDCPNYDSAEMQKWRDQRSERQKLDPAARQKLVQQHRDQMRQHRTAATTTP